jgi:hypothetical protein
MSKLKPITVLLKEGKHKTQPWSFTIDRPGPAYDETKKERYVTMRSAKRGAARVLAAHYGSRWDIILQQGTILERTKMRELRIRPVHFIIDRRKPSTKPK